MRLKTIVSVLCVLVLGACSTKVIKPFTTDGCSSFPDGTLKQKNLWLACCTAHDFAYWQGGTYHERLTADKELQACVAKVGEPAVAMLMLAGVRVGGSPFLPTTFRWGYGWPYPRLYKALSADETAQVRSASDCSSEHAVPWICSPTPLR